MTNTLNTKQQNAIKHETKYENQLILFKYEAKMT